MPAVCEGNGWPHNGVARSPIPRSSCQEELSNCLRLRVRLQVGARSWQGLKQLPMLGGLRREERRAYLRTAAHYVCILDPSIDTSQLAGVVATFPARSCTLPHPCQCSVLELWAPCCPCCGSQLSQASLSISRPCLAPVLTCKHKLQQAHVSLAARARPACLQAQAYRWCRQAQPSRAGGLPWHCEH